eukprot:GHVT01099156.1.p1 GENE.GHVT01099156.1~~GHVT01099156.1.p1  ORF type:complete len:260 (+),score=-2.84 GHVT01099156.1:418-1197(+)
MMPSLGLLGSAHGCPGVYRPFLFTCLVSALRNALTRASSMRLNPSATWQGPRPSSLVPVYDMMNSVIPSLDRGLSISTANWRYFRAVFAYTTSHAFEHKSIVTSSLPLRPRFRFIPRPAVQPSSCQIAFYGHRFRQHSEEQGREWDVDHYDCQVKHPAGRSTGGGLVKLSRTLYRIVRGEILLPPTLPRGFELPDKITHDDCEETGSTRALPPLTGKGAQWRKVQVKLERRQRSSSKSDNHVAKKSAQRDRRKSDRNNF